MRHPLRVNIHLFFTLWSAIVKVKKIYKKRGISMKDTFKKLSKVFLAFMMVLIMAAPIQKAEAATKVSAPKITSISNVSSGVTVKWSKVSNATGYYVYQKN